MTTSNSPADDGRKNSSESSYYAYIYCYFYVFTQLYKSLKYYCIMRNYVHKHTKYSRLLITLRMVIYAVRCTTYDVKIIPYVCNNNGDMHNAHSIAIYKK